MTSHPPDEETRAPGATRHRVAAAVACMAAGLAISVLPHLLWWPRLGEPVWIADWDDLGYYLAMGAQAYHGHPTELGDPSWIGDGRGINVYSRLQSVPGILVARALGLGPMGVGLAWRALAGLGVGLAWYLVFEHFVGRPRVAAALALIPMADHGLDHGRLLAEHALVTAKLAAGRPGVLLDSAPVLLAHWRIVNPALGMPYLLLFVWLLARARERPTPARRSAAGLGFGLLFYVYFYYWTAAVPALLLAWILDVGHRRVYLEAGLIGGLAGLPQVVSTALTRRDASPDWPLRVDVFYPVPRFSWPEIGKGYVLGVAVLAALLAWILARRRDLIAPWALAASGLAMLNHQVVTGLQMQNFHYHYVSGPILSLVLLLVLAPTIGDRAARSRWWAWGLAAAVLAHFAAGLWLRGIESTRSRASADRMANYQEYREQRLGPGSPRLAHGAVMAGAPDFVDFAVVLEDQRPLAHYSLVLSPGTGNAEYDERETLNSILLGVDRAAFEGKLRAPFVGPGVWSRDRDPITREALILDRLAFYDAIRADPDRALDRYHVRYVALPVGHPAPVGEGWSPLERGPHQDIWERRPPASARVGPGHRGTTHE
jgi:hypothetical protein